MRKSKYNWVFTFLIGFIWVLSNSLFSQTQNFDEIGRPFYNFYSSDIYGAHNQNWAVTQDSTDRIFIANNHGILRYDGHRWQKAPSLNGGLIRALVKDNDGVMYWGGQNDFGIVSSDSIGNTILVSLTDLIPDSIESYNNVWNILISEHGVYYRSNKYIFRYFDNKISIIENGRWFQHGFEVNGKIVVQQFPHGLFYLSEDSLSFIPNSEVFAKDNVGGIAPLDNGDWLVGTFFKGLFTYDGSSFSPFKSEISSTLERAMAYKALRLKSGNIALASIHEGLFVIDQKGSLVNRVHIEGLPTLELYEDDHHGIWAALDGGLARIELETPLTRFQKNEGLTGTYGSITRFNNEIYAGGNNGLFKLVQDGIEPAKFELIEGFNNQIWTLLPTENGLLIGSQQGLFVLADNSITPILNNLVVRKLYTSKIQPGTIMVGSMLNFRTLVFRNGKWSLSDPLPGIETNTHYIAESIDSVVWLGSHFQGATKLENFFNESPIKVTNYNDEDGFPERSDQYVKAFYLDDHIAFGTSEGLYQLDEISNTIVSDSSFGTLFSGPGKDVFRVKKAPDGVWFVRSSENGTLTYDKKGDYIWNDVPFRKITSNSTWDFLFDGDSIAWLGTTSGVYRFDRSMEKEIVHQKKVLIHSVLTTKNDSLIYGGHNSALMEEPELAYSENQLRFQFGLPHFTDPGQTSYSFRLIGDDDDDWSSWTKESQKDYTNLAFGSYSFEVKAKDMYDNISHPTSFGFIISPPWYRTGIANLFYIVLGIGFLYSLIVTTARLKSKQLEKRNRELELQVTSRTEEIEEQKTVIEKSLQEKEVLLKEIHHRVKNNLQIIYSLLNLQKSSIEDLSAIKAIETGQGRISSMSIVHEILYSSSDLKEIELSQYIQNLVDHISESYHTSDTRIDTAFNLEDCKLDINIAIPLGLTLNEIVSNAYKHAFNQATSGLISIKTSLVKNVLNLDISDNGTGFNADSSKPDSLGLQLVDDMIRQLKGSKEIIVDNGTTFRFTIPLAL